MSPREFAALGVRGLKSDSTSPEILEPVQVVRKVRLSQVRTPKGKIFLTGREGKPSGAALRITVEG